MDQWGATHPSHRSNPPIDPIHRLPDTAVMSPRAPAVPANDVYASEDRVDGRDDTGASAEDRVRTAKDRMRTPKDRMHGLGNLVHLNPDRMHEKKECVCSLAVLMRAIGDRMNAKKN